MISLGSAVESPAVYVIYDIELVYCTGNIISDIHSSSADS
jgi:hypothetical protein